MSGLHLRELLRDVTSGKTPPPDAPGANPPIWPPSHAAVTAASGIDGSCSFWDAPPRFGKWGVNVKRWERVSLLAFILLGGCGGFVVTQVGLLTSPSVGQPDVRSATIAYAGSDASTVSGYVLTATASGPVLATTTAVLSQESEKDVWQTTVLLSQATGECPGLASRFWLETTSPNKTVPASSISRVGTGPCRVTLTFKGAPKTLESASLVLDEAGVLSSTQLSLSRHVTLSNYFFIPFICGLIIAVVVLLVINFFIGFRKEGRAWRVLINRQFPIRTVSEEKVPKASFAPIATVVATFLGASTLASSLFPGVSIGVFVIVTAFVEGLTVVLGRALFSISQEHWVRRRPPNELGRPLALTPGKKHPLFSFPEGANIKSGDSLSMTHPGGAADQVPVGVSQISIPKNSKIEILTGSSVSFPEGPNIQLDGTSTFLVSNDDNNLRMTSGGDEYRLPRSIKATADTTITYDEESEPEFSPGDARAGYGGYGSRIFKLTKNRFEKPQVNLFIAIIPVLIAVFAVGAELGVIGVLSINFSDATVSEEIFASVLILLVAISVVYYVVRTVRTAADKFSDIPQSG